MDRGVDCQSLLHAGCNRVQPQNHGMENIDSVGNLAPTGGDSMDSVCHIYGVEAVDIRQASLTQRRSQVRVLFRPLKTPRDGGLIVVYFPPFGGYRLFVQIKAQFWN